MNEDQLNDLKQFVASTVSQSERRIKDELKQEIKSLDQKMDEGFAGVGEAIEDIYKHTDEQFKVVDTRLTKLEQQLA